MATKKNDNTPYAVFATAFGHKDQLISAALEKDAADAFADNLKASMDAIDGDFKVFDNIKVKKYEVDVLNPHKDEKNDPYDYSVLDELDKKISKGK